MRKRRAARASGSVVGSAGLGAEGLEALGAAAALSVPRGTSPTSTEKRAATSGPEGPVPSTSMA